MEDGVQQTERTWAMVAHVATFLGMIIPIGNILAPLGIWLWKRAEYGFAEEHARESLNFQISITLYLLAAGIILASTIANAFSALAVVFNVVVVFAGAWKAHRGEPFHYPISLRLVR